MPTTSPNLSVDPVLPSPLASSVLCDSPVPSPSLAISKVGDDPVVSADAPGMPMSALTSNSARQSHADANPGTTPTSVGTPAGQTATRQSSRVFNSAPRTMNTRAASRSASTAVAPAMNTRRCKRTRESVALDSSRKRSKR
ncbi:hypothetical protein BD410DRAFT_833376 [Rickenella mellea]|uniref:Uncharacterized protein n=1 Tax=Rickenella mellea TaxID=50990 RepID=A0A4R5XE29_9AGAM|nr:hypothetical protein BD410DRAFT_833376 [Rickenella mellea]